MYRTAGPYILAQSGHPEMSAICPLSGVKRISNAQIEFLGSLLVLAGLLPPRVASLSIIRFEDEMAWSHPGPVIDGNLGRPAGTDGI